jgi:hypothetical protein
MQSPHLVTGYVVLPTLFVLLAASMPGCGGLTSQAGATGAAPPEGGTPAEAGAPPEARALSCPETPPTLQAGGTVITFQTDPVLGGKAMIYGQPNALPGGGTLTPLNLRFFLSNVALVGGDGNLIPVDLVTPAGTLEPYGVHFFNAESAPSTAWSIRAPAGSYRGMSLTLGVSDACNANRNAFPAESQLTWPPPFGYLFLRFEARVHGLGLDGGAPSGGIDGGVEPVTAIAMGGLIGSLFAPIVHIDHLLTVPESGPIMRHLRFDMDQVFKGATANVDVSRAPPGTPAGLGPPGLPGASETLAGERLRLTAPDLPIFVLDP